MDVLLKFQKQLKDVVYSNKSGYLYELNKISNIRAFELIENDKPTPEEIYQLVEVIDLDILEQMYKLVNPNWTQSDINLIYTRYLAKLAYKEKINRSLTWDQVEEKFGFTKQDHQRLLKHSITRPTTDFLSRLIGFVDADIVAYCISKIHAIDEFIDSKQLIGVATVEEFSNKAMMFSIGERMKLINEIVVDFSLTDKIDLFRLIFS